MEALTIAIDDPGELAARVPADGLAWLRNGDGLVGIGIAARYRPLDAADAERWWNGFTQDLRCRNELPEVFGTGPLAFASLVFDPDNTASASVLTVPELIIGRRHGNCWLTSVGDRGNRPALPAVGPAPTPPATAAVSPVGLDAGQWRRAVAETVSRLNDPLTKVVLARALRIQTSAPIDPRWLVRKLAENYPTCWTYCHDGLVGATPELLVRRERGLVTSRVLAGTIRRNGGEELDLKLAHSLARSSKNLVEHELAVESVADALAKHSWSMNVPERPFVLELPNVLHLASDVTASVHDDASALRVAGALHPSAAVCGTPTGLARATIAELEHLDRGRYSGPVGWIDSAGDGEFGIGLRCGQIDAADPSSIRIYAGCGIVAESDPAEEYAETEAKLIPMLQTLGIG
ncbi:MAG: isochorismate synthase [Propionibacteriaceae bacterium]|jgi:menaquinone-specific isochorismate synthase|nr:isochorismate synthase [Propionibacteriaceae bacterium]